MPIYSDFFKGISPSKKFQNKFDEMINCDVHSEIGSLQCQKALEKKSGTLITAGCYMAVVPNGDTYFFSKSDGKIWKRAIADGAYTLVRTGTNGAYKGCAYYRNYLYYSMDAFLGRFDMTSTWNDNFQVLTADKPHPIHQFDLILYVADGLNVASLDDSATWSASVLDLPIEYNISALIPYGDDLLTLANPGNYITDAGIFRWNTYSDSWSLKDSIKETNAYAFLDSDNYVNVICSNGNIYTYDGAKLHLISNIRNPKATTGHQLTTNLEGKPLVANGGRIYSLYKKNKDMPLAFVGEYTCSAGDTATIHSIAANGSNLLVSWEVTVEAVTTYGIDEISTSYAVAQVVTPRFKKAGTCRVHYDDLNGGTIGIESKLDSEDTWTTLATFDDSDDGRYVKNEDTILIKSGAQARITLTPNPVALTTTPVVDRIEITN